MLEWIKKTIGRHAFNMMLRAVKHGEQLELRLYDWHDDVEPDRIIALVEEVATEVDCQLVPAP